MANPLIVFVPTAADAPAGAPGSTIVVTDVTWTPGPDDRVDLVPLRPAIASMVGHADLFEEALNRLDAWADATGMPDRMQVGDVTYWYRLREDAWNWLHERLAWSHLIAGLSPGGARAEVVVAGDEPALWDVARALAAVPQPVAAEAAERGSSASVAVRPVGGWPRSWFGRWRPSHRRELARRREVERRTRLLDARVRMLAAERPGPVLVLSHTGILQVVDAGEGRRMVDPNLGAVIDRLRRDGQRPIVVGLGLDHRDDAAWSAIENDDRLLPLSLLQTRWRAADEDVSAPGPAVLAALRDAPPVPLEVDGADLAPALLARVRSFADATLPVLLRQARRVEALLAELGPRAILMTHEGIRTPWLVAARRRRVPTFAVQHGILYPTHPGYRHPRRPDLVLPDVTFVFGPYERDVLLAHGGYDPAEVEVSGSPRLDLDRDAAGERAARTGERGRVRRELGVADDDRLLVVSTVFLELSRRFYLAPLLDRVLGGPLPGVHLVFKQHPGETDTGPYRVLLEGIARARGHALPPITVVRDNDLYRLLRAADAHLGLHSTVLTDAVVAGTPNLIAVGQAHADLLGYVAAGVATPVRDITDLRAALADPRPPDPAARRAFLDAHFRPGDASARIAAAIALRADTA